jgi:hypothetical protein
MHYYDEVPAIPFHSRYLELIEHIERRFPVAQWISGDVEIWPLARMDLYLDMYWANVGGELPKSRPMPLRALSSLATPLKNFWRSRADLRHWIVRPKPADAIFLGDGVSLDFIDGAWQDRYFEPVIQALESRGLSAFLMQGGDLARLPWHRPTFATNSFVFRGGLSRLKTVPPADMPEHKNVVEFLAEHGVPAGSSKRAKLELRASAVSESAAAFQRVLGRVKPKLAFVVTYYAGLGPAFMLACRREGVLSIDLQHCPRDGAHKAYDWIALPENGYGTLPAVFWSWTQRDAADIQRWSNSLALPWHQGLHGGHTQLSPYLDDSAALTRIGDAKFAALTKGTRFEREILVALQPVGGYRDRWDALAAQIEAAPPSWRWWIRRHPAASAYQDAEFARLVSLRRSNVVVEESSVLPLPTLLRHMSVVVSRFSGASTEAAFLGVPAIFISEEARGQFSELIDQGFAAVVAIEGLNAAIDALSTVRLRRSPMSPPELGQTLDRLTEMARDYSKLFPVPTAATQVRKVSHQ